MTFYPLKINNRFLKPHKAGDLVDANGNGSSASFVCGAVLQIKLKIANNFIINAKFKVAGCGFLFAAADLWCEKNIGENINQDFDLFKIIQDELGEFKSSRQHCIELVEQAWQMAINDFRGSQKNDWNGDEILICTCFGVSEQTIETGIADNLLTTVEEVTQICRAGGGCGSCQPLIQEILDRFYHSEI